MRRGGERQERQGEDGATTVSRDGLWRAQTPQAFRLGALNAAHAAWSSESTPTDDAAVIEAKKVIAQFTTTEVGTLEQRVRAAASEK